MLLPLLVGTDMVLAPMSGLGTHNEASVVAVWLEYTHPCARSTLAEPRRTLGVRAYIPVSCWPLD